MSLFRRYPERKSALTFKPLPSHHTLFDPNLFNIFFNSIMDSASDSLPILIVAWSHIFFMHLVMISRSIGDVYLQKSEFNREPLFAKFRPCEPIKRPILSSDPAISVLQLQPHDQFIISASDGLWEHLSNQEAVDIVQKHPYW
ncbi:hypothetical protein POM88_006514 [Heracleum sosnowskyi]|uniref:PPM-type phosphatase domain-containing protein n=1 Tax=Heracleum sosnowskyi TaxID=360622 RepID=A0AAD8J3M1_9APIA|nr:hypothetical protein POM88_006514 [Heracleum sosnowskyi]